MHIGIVTHKVLRGDGQGRVNYEVARAAVRRGHRVVLLASEVAPELVTNHLITWIQIPVDGWFTNLLRNQAFAWKSSRWLRAHRDEPDVVLANGFITWYPVEVNAVHFVHSAWRRSPVHVARIRRGPYAWYRWIYTTLNAHWEKRAFRQAQVIIAVSNQVRDELTEIGIPAERIQVISNGVDPEEFSPGAVDRRPLGLPEGVLLGLFVGDIRTPRKNLDTVLEAMREVPPLHLAVVGNVEGSPYPKMASRLGINDRVHFLGYRCDVPQIMRAADLCLCPSRYEPFSLVLAEALASGLPVITARTVGAAHLVTPACGIILEDPDDTVALVHALRTLASDDMLRETMGRAGRAVAEHHSFKQMAQQYVDLFEELHSNSS